MQQTPTSSWEVEHWRRHEPDCRGAWFANAPNEVGIRTADAALSLILTVARGLSTQFLYARAGKWRDPSVRPLNWRKSTLGIFGLGNIGKQVADSAKALGFTVIYNNRSEVQGSGYEWVSKEELLRRSDIILLLVPLTPSTRHLIDKSAFDIAKDGVILVNVGEWSLSSHASLASLWI